jgi:membrane protein
MPSGDPKPLTNLSRDDWRSIVAGAYERFGEVQLSDRAAALAYFGFLSLFPALIVALAALALVGDYPETYRSIIDALRDAAPGTAVDTIDSGLRGVMDGSGAGSLLGIGLIFTFITASGAVGATIRSLEAINGTREAATFVRSNLTRLWLTLALMLLFMVAFAALVLAGPLFESIAEAAGLGDTGRTVISLGRYPAGLLAVLGATLLLYTRAPAGAPRRLVDHLPGAVFAAVLWVLASVAFSFYVSNFGSYDKTYGSLGAVIVLLIWIYVSGIALLLGALLNQQLLRVRGLL